MKTIKVHDKEFELFLSQKEIEDSIEKAAQRISKDMDGKNPLFVCVLNGSFMFASELMKRMTIPCEISFVKMSSYEGANSTGKLKEICGLAEDITGRSIIIVEDIVDTGNTMVQMLSQLRAKNPKEIKVATLLLKPDALENEVPLDYVIAEVPNYFIVGYGLDYDHLGRNYPEIYKLKTK